MFFLANGQLLILTDKLIKAVRVMLVFDVPEVISGPYCRAWARINGKSTVIIYYLFHIFLIVEYKFSKAK